jgi:hypothetical protein
VSGVSLPSPACPRCGSPMSESLRYCAGCRYDLGAPNLRLANLDRERAALDARVAAARQAAITNGCLVEFDTFAKELEQRSAVVISVPALVLRMIVSDTRMIYVNIEKLIAAGVRVPPTFADDSHRRLVAGALFGSFGEAIAYGALSLTTEGVPTYGDMFCRLRTIAVEDRVSFLEENSYSFVKHRLSPNGGLPFGYRSGWKNRHLLALAKLAPKLRPGSTVDDWQKLLVSSDGVNRAKDDFVEAHVYDGFNVFSIDDLVPIPGKKLSRDAQLDVRIVMERFKEHLASRPK